MDRTRDQLRRLQRRIERSCAAYGLNYPWWIPTYSSLAIIGLDVAAFAQRGSFSAPPTTLAAAVVALVPLAVWMVSGRLWPTPIEGVVILVAVLLYLHDPAAPDLAPWLLMVSAGEVAAISPVVVPVVVSGGYIAALIVAGALGHLANVPLYVIAVVVGADVGVALRWQMRALAAERANSAIVAERATLSERQRIAREVHDVVGHALSINLLHVTAARHALTDHADVPDAVESLVEAERVGRSAMADLRRTVAVLGSSRGETQALPGVDDLGPLVERARGAGLDVHHARLDADALRAVGRHGTAAELGVYRVVQESLANIAKHAPSAAVTIDVILVHDAVHVVVRNALPSPHPRRAGDGSGLPGMAARAEQMGAALRTGVEDGEWVVALILSAGRDRTGEPDTRVDA